MAAIPTPSPNTQVVSKVVVAASILMGLAVKKLPHNPRLIASSAMRWSSLSHTSWQVRNSWCTIGGAQKPLGQVLAVGVPYRLCKCADWYSCVHTCLDFRRKLSTLFAL